MDSDLIKRSQDARDATVDAVARVRQSTRIAERTIDAAEEAVKKSVALERGADLGDGDA